MSYTPTNWQTGDTITAAGLNNMESGIENANNPFIVTLTPTAQDFSGTMDKTVAEINAAYEAGRKIVFRVMRSATVYIDVDCSIRYVNGDYVYPSFEGYLIMINQTGALVHAYTGATDDGTKQTYGTHIFPLTPMS